MLIVYVDNMGDDVLELYRSKNVLDPEFAITDLWNLQDPREVFLPKVRS